MKSWKVCKMLGKGKVILDELKARWGQPKFIHRNFFQIAKFHTRKKQSDSAYVISERTRAAVDFTELFSFLDRTVSRVGQQWLYDRLSSYDRKSDFTDSEALIQYWADNPNDRLTAQAALSRLNHEHAYGICTLFFDKLPRPPWFLWLIRGQSIISVIALVVTAINIKLFLFLVACLGINSLVHYYCKGFIQHYAFALDQLSLMAKTAGEISKLSFPHPDKAEVASSLKSLREVTNLWNIYGDGGKADTTELGWLLREYVKIIFLIEPVMFFRALAKLNHCTSSVQQVYEYIGSVDASISILSVRQSVACCIPDRVSSEKGRLSAENMVHPLIMDCTPNSIELEDRSLLITGSNMSGKSAFIRTVAINVLCSHTINTCFARNFSSSFFKVHAVTNISDDLMLGKSYYMEEVISIRDMIDRCTAETECLFLLDEIFRGTNTTERIAAAYSVLSFLNKQNIAISATHDAELTTMLEDTFDMYYFSESIEGTTISFDYILKKGKLEHGNAIRILEANGYPSEVVDMARRIYQQKLIRL